MGLFGSILKGAGSLIPGGGLVQAGIGALGSLAGGSGGDDAIDQATRMKMQEWKANAPLRDKSRTLAMQGIGQRPDLGALFGDTGNPYSRGSLVHQLANGTEQPPALPQAPPEPFAGQNLGPLRPMLVKALANAKGGR